VRLCCRGAAAEHALDADATFEPGQALTKLVLDGRVTGVTLPGNAAGPCHGTIFLTPVCFGLRAGLSHLPHDGRAATRILSRASI
jgi:hypothetical protein